MLERPLLVESRSETQFCVGLAMTLKEWDRLFCKGSWRCQTLSLLRASVGVIARTLQASGTPAAQTEILDSRCSLVRLTRSMSIAAKWLSGYCPAKCKGHGVEDGRGVVTTNRIR